MVAHFTTDHLKKKTMKKHCPCIPVLTKISHEQLVSISLSPCIIMYVLLVSPRPFCFYSQIIRISVSVCFLKDDLAVPVLFFFIAEGVILAELSIGSVLFIISSVFHNSLTLPWFPV